MEMKIRRWLTSIAGTLGVIALVGLSPLTAGAVTALTYNDNIKNIQQTSNRPCVIGSPSCTQLLDFTKVGPSDNPAPNLTSPTYTVQQLVDLVGSTAMNLLVDVNQTGGSAPANSIVTELIEVFINGVLQFVFNGPQTTPLAGSLQGNGFSDAGFVGINFAGFAGTDKVSFHIKWSSADDGAESWFLATTTAPPVPEPGLLLLVGSGVVGVAFAAFRLRRR